MKSPKMGSGVRIGFMQACACTGLRTAQSRGFHRSTIMPTKALWTCLCVVKGMATEQVGIAGGIAERSIRDYEQIVEEHRKRDYNGSCRITGRLWRTTSGDSGRLESRLCEKTLGRAGFEFRPDFCETPTLTVTILHRCALTRRIL